MRKNCHLKQLAPADVERVLKVCEQLHCVEQERSFIPHSHEILSKAFSTIHISSVIYQLAPFRRREREIHTSEYDRWFPRFKKSILDHPTTQHYMFAVDTRNGMTNLESESSPFRYAKLSKEFHDQVLRHTQLWIGVRDGNELLHFVYSCRKEFTEKQLAAMCLIQPHLESAWKNWRRAGSLARELLQYKAIVASTQRETADSLYLRKALDSLTDRQRDVVKLVAAGGDNQQVADQLKISILTVKKHLQAIFQTLGVHHRTELAALWHQAFSAPPYLG